MSFTIYDKQPGGGTGEISAGLAGEAVEVWTLVASDINHSTEDVRASGLLPSPFVSYHPQNARLLARPAKVAQDSDNPTLFICTLTWTSEPLTPEEKEEKENDPLNRIPKIKVKTAHRRETRHRDFYGKPKVNMAGDLFDPPIESNISYKIITIRKNVTVFPDWVFNFDDAVNLYDFVIKNRTIKKGCAWIANIELGEIQTDKSVPYCEAFIEIHVRKPRKPVGAETVASVPSPWDTEQLNEGLFYLSFGVRKKIYVDDDSTPPKRVPAPAPVPLTLTGAVLDPVKIDNATYVVFQDQEKLDFNQIAFLWSNA